MHNISIMKTLLYLVTLICSIFFGLADSLHAQLLLNELASDSGNNDSENDAFVELINAGTSDIDVGCNVISNSEWIVVLPPGTIITAGDVFLIACSEGQNIGSNPNPSPGSGLTCTNCDFPNLPIGFDVCDPANAAFVDFAVTGFSLDNARPDDGDQVVLFNGIGALLDAVVWGCGSAFLTSDNTTLADPTCTTTAGRGGGDMNYTLGSATWNGMGDEAQLPPALQIGGACYDASVTYTMPSISSGNYAIVNPVQNSCNSSIIRVDGDIVSGTGGSWTQTEHPNPGELNSVLDFQFFIDNNPVDNGTINNIVCTTPEPITITVEIYNYQHVEDVALNTSGSRTTIGSYFSVNGSAPTFWNGGISGAGSGTTTLSHTYTPSNGDQLVLVWDDWTQSPLNPNCCGTSSTTVAQSGNDNISQNGSDECYESLTINFEVETPIAGTPVITCDDAATGFFSVSGITAGTSVSYELVYTGPGSSPIGDEIISQSSTGMITLANNTDPDRNNPSNYIVRAMNPCGSVIVTGLVCIGNPPCPDPQGATLNGASDPITICPADCFDLTVDESMSANLPDGGTIDWFYGTSSDFDPCDPLDTDFGGQLDNSSNITVTGSAGKVGVIINEVLYDPSSGDTSGANSNESFELFNNTNSAIDVSNWVVTDGDSELIISSGSVIPSCGYLSLIFPPSLTNSGEQLGLYDDTGVFIDGVFWEGGQNINDPTNNNCIHDITIGGSTMTVNICNDINAAGIVDAGVAGDGESLELNSDGTWSDVIPSSEPLTGSANTDQSACPVSGSMTTVTTANNCFDASFCNNGPFFIKGIVNPSSMSSTCSKADVTVGSFEINVVCPEVVLSGTNKVCAPNTTDLTVTINNAPPNAAVTGTTATNAATANSFVTTNPALPMTDASGNLSYTITGISETGDYSLSSVSITGSPCPTISGIASVIIFPQPSITLSGNITVCPGEVAQLPITINSGISPFEVEVDTDGDGIADLLSSVNNSGLISIPTSVNDAGSTLTIDLLNIIDENDCTGIVSGTGIINVSQVPTPAIEGANSDVCINSDDTSASLNWNINDPGTGFIVDIYDVTVGGNVLVTGNDLPGGGGVITYSETIGTLGTSFPQTITRFVELTNTTTGCTNFTRTPISVTVNSNPNFSPTLTQPTCTTDGMIQFSEILVGTYTYEFSTTGAAPFTTVNPAGGNIVIPITQGTQAASDYAIRVVRTDVTPECETMVVVNVPAVSGCDSCMPPVINNQAIDQELCSSNLPIDVVFTVNGSNSGTGMSLDYQWEVSTDGGVTYTEISMADAASITVTVTDSNFDGNMYRLKISDPIDPTNCMVISDPALLTINSVGCVSFPWDGN